MVHKELIRSSMFQYFIKIFWISYSKYLFGIYVCVLLVPVYSVRGFSVNGCEYKAIMALWYSTKA